MPDLLVAMGLGAFCLFMLQCFQAYVYTESIYSCFLAMNHVIEGGKNRCQGLKTLNGARVLSQFGLT